MEGRVGWNGGRCVVLAVRSVAVLIDINDDSCQL